MMSNNRHDDITKNYPPTNASRGTQSWHKSKIKHKINTSQKILHNVTKVADFSAFWIINHPQ